MILNWYETLLCLLLTLILALFLWVMKLTSFPVKPKIYGRDKAFADLLKQCTPELEEKFKPTTLWGYNGHLQTAMHSILGKMKSPWPIGKRVYIKVDCGSTLTYDIYERLEAHLSGKEVTLILCPGICNSSESIYIRTFVHHARRKGYHCAVINHIGAIPAIKLTSCRIFSYGCTKDFHRFVQSVMEAYPSTLAILVGFSMGANIIAKYLGERRSVIPKNIIGGISICQGYDAQHAIQTMHSWSNFRRLYQYLMTAKMKRVLLAHKEHVFSKEAKNRYNLNESSVFSAGTLSAFDKAYSMKLAGCRTLEEFYKQTSSAFFLNNITVPLVFFNALDDPLIAKDLLKWPMEYSKQHDRSALIVTKHGGHLGFYDGGWLRPNIITWLDRTLIGIADAILHCNAEGTPIQQ